MPPVFKCVMDAELDALIVLIWRNCYSKWSVYGLDLVLLFRVCGIRAHCSMLGSASVAGADSFWIPS